MFYTYKMRWYHRLCNVVTTPIRMVLMCVCLVSLPIQYIVTGKDICDDFCDWCMTFLEIEEF